MSKLDYLKKYGLSSTSSSKSFDSSPHKKRKRPHHESKNLIIIDDDDGWDKKISKEKSSEDVDDRWANYSNNNGKDDDDQPVIVENIEIEKSIIKGNWEDIYESKISKSDDERNLSRSNHTSGNKDGDEDDEYIVRRKLQQKPVIVSSSSSRRHDSDNDNEDDDEDDEYIIRRKPQQKSVIVSSSSSRRHDGDNDDENDMAPPRKPINTSNSSSSLSSDKPRAKTASGHLAGLQSGDTFGKTEREIHQKNQLALSTADKSLSGIHSDTIYRDKSGKKVDMLDEYMKQQALQQGKQAKLLQAQQEYNRGRTQKEQIIEKQRELEEIALEPFARTIDDPKLESWRKDQLREGDPMAEYFQKKKEKEKEKISNQGNGNNDDSNNRHLKPTKPIYRGPNAPVNRFGIRPGYRWDGVNRGNEFEWKVLNKNSEKTSIKEDQYKWSVSDM